MLLLPALAQAPMYRWIDDSGKVHYSDQARELVKPAPKQAHDAGVPK